MSSSNNVKLNEIASFQNGGGWTADKYSDSGIPVVRVSDIHNETIDLSDCKYLPESLHDKYKKYELKEDDLVICTVGSHPTQPNSVVGRSCRVPSKADGALLNQNAVRIRPAVDKFDKMYLSYIGASNMMRNHIIAHARGSASQVRMSIGNLKKFTFELPPIETQKKIASTVSAFDDLISTNTRRIEILEEMARRIYREWFVHFRYPGHEDDDPSTSSGQRLVDSGTELGAIPEGWELGTVGDLYQVKSGHPFRSKNLMDDGNFGVIKIGNITQDGEIDIDNVQYLEDDIVPDRAHKYLLKPGDILIAMSGAKVGKVGIMPKSPNNYYLNQRVGKYFAEVEGVRSHLFLYNYLKTDYAQTMIKHLAQGAAQPNISATDLKSLELIIPTNKIFEKFEKQTQSLRDQMLLLRQKNRKLKQTRDLLLPKLISGKIDVEELELESVGT